MQTSTIGGILSLGGDSIQQQLLLTAIEKIVLKAVRTVNADVLEAVASDSVEFIEKMVESHFKTIIQQLTEIRKHLGMEICANNTTTKETGTHKIRKAIASRFQSNQDRPRTDSNEPPPCGNDDKKKPQIVLEESQGSKLLPKEESSKPERAENEDKVATQNETGTSRSRWRTPRELVLRSSLHKITLSPIVPTGRPSEDTARRAEPPRELLPGMVRETEEEMFKPARFSRHETTNRNFMGPDDAEKFEENAVTKLEKKRGKSIMPEVRVMPATIGATELNSNRSTGGRVIASPERFASTGRVPTLPRNTRITSNHARASLQFTLHRATEVGLENRQYKQLGFLRQDSAAENASGEREGEAPIDSLDGLVDDVDKKMVHVRKLAAQFRMEIDGEETALTQHATTDDKGTFGHRISVNSQARSKRLNQEDLERMVSLIPDERNDTRKTWGSLAAFMEDPREALSSGARLMVADPHSQKRLSWDLVISILLMYHATIIPFFLSFYLTDEQRAESQLIKLLPVQDLVFAINIIVTCFTGFHKDGALVRDPRVLTIHYLKTWFVIDLIGAFPYIVFASESALCLWLRLLRLAIVVRTAYLRHQIMSIIEYRMENEILLLMVGVVKLVMLLILVAHWGACIWWAVGVRGYLAEEGPRGWIAEFGSVDEDWWQSNRIQQYATCLYFMTSTITTVGYGDIHASSHAERVFCIICEILAGNLFALFSGLLCSLILTYDEVGADFRARLKTVMRYMHSNNVDRGVQMKVRRFLERLFQNQANEQAKTALLTMLRTSDGLRHQVLVGVMGKMLRHYKWFDMKITDAQLGRVASVVITKYFAPGDLVFYAGDKAECMLFVVRGLIKCKRDRTPIHVSTAPNMSRKLLPAIVKTIQTIHIFYGYEAGGAPILPLFPTALPQTELVETYGNDIEGRTLIHLAAESGQVDMLEFLINTKLFPLPSSLEAFTQPNPAPQVEMPGLAAGAGHTPLHLAAIRGHMDIVTSLVDAGVNVNITNRLGQTILDVALKYHQEEVINFIRALDLYNAAKQGDMCASQLLNSHQQTLQVKFYS
ncbi:Potassium channel GORK, putative [Perkinsus marinus ATCC 50983]|uniref:Potassium channel GORK, putative n=2 Tax=Perkinsus marinus (strain ATCC 50983 / TXsc) TaxID=423536 RepID=C5M158_PERM5|nr:Potassium channel GORK, putative [Perkinsus marinus ATCC 50983]EEQ97288.1 Potassium channel GORK, putative [Perkinsus marinus ATCC 50983]|eukprot:XP_002764571.1 Potassium channel GORK, putative [Perkinsus marinus ATCC 50983]